MKTYKAKGIVLNSVKYGESGLILYLYTDLFGRQEYIVQGLRSKGKKNSFFQPLFILDFIGYEPRYGSMHKIKEISLSPPLTTIPFDIRKNTISLFIAELIYRMVREANCDAKLFEFIHDSIITLDNTNEGISNFHMWFLVNLTYFLGIYPGNNYCKDHYFDIIAGEFTKDVSSSHTYFNLEDSEILGKFMNASVSEINDIKLSGLRRSNFLNSLFTFIGYHTDSINKIKSIDVLKEIF
ncbi:MAG: DNA repair protein RecO [Rikenellaceae bacterium]|nr:DNA repair protein RecO [Rikenellaceae bacterium]